jgi:hypothetical protein
MPRKSSEEDTHFTELRCPSPATVLAQTNSLATTILKDQRSDKKPIWFVRSSNNTKIGFAGSKV